MKNRTKKMMFMTLVATLAVATLMMARGLAAPVAYKSCPDTAALTSALKSAATNSTCPSSQVMIQLLSAPNANLSSMLGNATIQDLLAKYGVKLSTVPCSTVKPTATPAPTKTAAPTATAKPTATPAPTATARPTATPAPTKTVAPTATAKPTATPAPSGSMTADEQKMINLVNADRAANGLPALTFDASLRAGALSHSVDMSQNNYFSHTSPTYGDFTTRVKAAGIKYSAAGENIAMYGSVETAETAFMNSPGHRANILNTSYTRIGIGIVHNSNGYYYITQWFAK